MNSTADRMAAAYFDAIEFLCEVTPKGWYAEQGTARAAVTQARVATLNVAYDTTREPDLGALDKMATEVGRQAERWSIMVRKADDDVAALAARHGLLNRSEMPLMACDAKDLVFRVGLEQRKPVRRVGAAESDLYTEVLTEGFEAPEGIFGSLMGGGVLDADPVSGYLAEESGRPAGTGLGIVTRGVVGVFNIAVAASARGCGLGRAITETVLADGIAAGADAAYLQSSEMGRPLYESMGFRLVENWTVFLAG
ncbi:N-acetyltransferase [Micromonospora sp. 15K316]|uniref:GNAT family N-acetyltransferase n=1 Tax=Micromonospora sp. 15K316 TaxID=2530376 RepID=UPI00104333C1|nr:GNAT family N-acetyltransferase [Micromonospora sp. 15K316]TDC38694.1 N-acetyltransferase [Micromonospora sp. 15K316]